MQKINWILLSQKAWEVRENAYILGETKVGASVLSENDKIYCGCNVEHKYRCHDIHAEVNAISNMVSNGEIQIKAILIVAERDFFTPCGGCMDWIMQYANENTLVGFQNSKSEKIQTFKVFDLMPYYPK